jgi:hypothetical protein
MVRPRQLVEIRATKSQIMLHSTIADSIGETLLATHPRAIGRGVRVVEEAQWDGLPTGKGRRTTTGDATMPQPRRERPRGEESGPLRALLDGPGYRWTTSSQSPDGREFFRAMSARTGAAFTAGARTCEHILESRPGRHKPVLDRRLHAYAAGAAR